MRDCLLLERLLGLRNSSLQQYKYKGAVSFDWFRWLLRKEGEGGGGGEGVGCACNGRFLHNINTIFVYVIRIPKIIPYTIRY